MVIPWRTILVSFLFFVSGSLFLLFGVKDWYHGDYQQFLEKVLIGMILFIPGVYHTYLAVQAFRGLGDFGDLTAFEPQSYR